MVIRLKIGSITLASAAALAPMAGVADRAFRELCVRFGAAYVVGEMVSAKGITMGDRKSARAPLPIGGGTPRSDPALWRRSFHHGRSRPKSAFLPPTGN